jgi:hypothetical protein
MHPDQNIIIDLYLSAAWLIKMNFYGSQSEIPKVDRSAIGVNRKSIRCGESRVHTQGGIGMVASFFLVVNETGRTGSTHNQGIGLLLVG